MGYLVELQGTIYYINGKRPRKMRKPVKTFGSRQKVEKWVDQAVFLIHEHVKGAENTDHIHESLNQVLKTCRKSVKFQKTTRLGDTVIINYTAGKYGKSYSLSMLKKIEKIVK